MGLVGSLHCAAMCGPLALAVPVLGTTKSEIFASRLIYNLGRTLTYGALGLVFGAIGKSLLLAGFQQWLSIAAGVAMLCFLIFDQKRAFAAGGKTSAWIKAVFRIFLQRRSFGAILALGAANGLLPCGLVYMAGTASAATGDVVHSALYMIFFGLGTVPMMLGMTFFSGPLRAFLQRFRLKPLVPLAVTLVALTLILRGLALDIPYISPASSNGAITCPACPR
ncbi:MAG TPA: sulfite exporter TauE/SafE family protein [Verrucomicrobiae bacterium]